MIEVAQNIATKLQGFLATRFGVRVPIVVTSEYRDTFTEPTIWIMRSAIADPDGGMDLGEDLYLKEFVRPDNQQLLRVTFEYHQIGPTNEIDYWVATVSGADENDRQFLHDLFSATPWRERTGWGGWGRHLVPTFEFNGVREEYK